MVSAPQSCQVDPRLPGKGGFRVRYEGWRFPQDGVVARLGQTLRDEVFMDPGPLGSSRGDRGYSIVKTAVVGGRGLVDSSGGRGCAMEMIAGVAGVGCSSEELGSPHVQMVHDREDLRFRVQVRDGSGLGAPRGYPQR